jgi:putative alpha-1,2-mannosidase
MVSNAEEEPTNWYVEGRGGLESWKSLNCIPVGDVSTNGTGLLTKSVSRTIEYAHNDLCVAEMAKATGNMVDYEKYLGRS